MAKLLKDILKAAHDTIKGVRPSTTDAGSLGKDPGVDYDPKAGDEQEFVAKHSVQKWDDPNGNKTDVFNGSNIKYALDKPSEKRHGNTEDEAKASYFRPVKEAKEVEEAKCNMTEAGKMCPVHEMADCSKMSKINEKELDEAQSPRQKAAANRAKTKDVRVADPKSNFEMDTHKVEAHVSKDGGAKEVKKETIKAQDKNKAIFNTQMKWHKQGYKVHDVKHKGIMHESVEQVDEVLTKKTSAGEVISDFIHSKDPKFKGKSKEERKRMALGAYYGMHPEKSKKTNEEVEQVDEISKATLGSYVKKSAQDLKNVEAGRKPNADYATHVATNRKQDNRTKGISRAVGKLTNEDLAVPLLGGDPPRGDSDEAAEMVRAELKALANKAMHLVMQMPDSMHVEPWCQAKIAQAKAYVNDVHDYMIYGDHEEPEKEQMDTPMTFPNMSVDVNTGRNV